MQQKLTIFWHRRDLRLEDNAGLFQASNSSENVVGLFIFDKHILDKLEDPSDARVTFIHDTITALRENWRSHGSELLVYYGTPESVWTQLLKNYSIQEVHSNADWEPYAKERDRTIELLCLQHQVPFRQWKDHVVFSGQEVLKDDGNPYTVFTPYSRKWKQKLWTNASGYPVTNAKDIHALKAFDSAVSFSNTVKIKNEKIPTLKEMGFSRSAIIIPPREVPQGIVKNYDKTRDFPAIEGTSKLGIHFRFGTISIREKARKALSLNETFLNELIWRDFYSMILFHFPKVVGHAFKPAYDEILWVNDPAQFKAWCDGKTGYPLVDAGMRQLNATGYMHNRVRMVVSSFLTKHLLIDWRWGEQYFAGKLLDFDLASNNGGWQWAAGCGTDAAPYFRIFNPSSQQQKFDPQAKYIREWVPEWGTNAYPKPLVDHSEARQRCLAVYQAALNKPAKP